MRWRRSSRLICIRRIERARPTAPGPRHPPAGPPAAPARLVPAAGGPRGARRAGHHVRVVRLGADHREALLQIDARAALHVDAAALARLDVLGLPVLRWPEKAVDLCQSG